ncbi:MAG: hypothetical protein E7166_06305 [Firmicutes bacterium]|nr:hypothetical protein [Bacillota bacterium]
MEKYNVIKIAKLLDKIFKAGFNTEKEILLINLEDLQKIPGISGTDIKILVDLKKAIKSKKLIAFFSGIEEGNEENGKTRI